MRSLAELAPDLPERVLYRVDECDGKPLARGERPLRPVLCDESKPWRRIRQLGSPAVRQAAP